MSRPELTLEQRQTIAARIRDNVPDELRKIKRFVIWKYGDTPNNQGKYPKLPVHYETFKKIDVYDPNHWLTFNHAVALFSNHSDLFGIGFKPAINTGYGGKPHESDTIRMIDFDNCVTDGVITDQDVQYWVDRLQSYTEISPSGKGVRVVARFDQVIDQRGENGEIYSTKNYCSLTGDVIGDARTITDITQHVDELLQYIKPTEPEKPRSEAKSIPTQSPVSDDNQLWNVMFHAKNGAAIQKLFDGDLSDYADDHSRGDLALCGHLAFYTHNDASRMDCMFRQTGLMRNKWERDDYRDWTIQKAISETRNFYAPGNGNGHRDVEGNGYAWGSDGDDIGDDTDDTEERFSESVEKKLKSLGYSFALNLLDSTIEVNGKRLDDVVEARIFTGMRDKGMKSRDAIRDVFTVIAGNNAYHPVKNYLESLQWDGQNHIGKLSTYFRDSHDPIIQENGVKNSVFAVWLGKWLIGTVAKIYSTGAVRAQPPMLVLDGEQNLGKSTFALWLGSALPELFIESDIKPDDVEHKRYLSTKWIWEVGELGSTTKKADREALKRFITQAESTFRIPYARHPVTKPALASFIGTVNNELGFLNDPTGNRRYLCVNVNSIDHSYQQKIDINQIWAQSYALFQQGVSWRLSQGEMAMQTLINGGYTQDLPLIGFILKHFSFDQNDKRSRLTTSDIVSVLQDDGVKGETRSIEMKVAETLRGMGAKQDTNARPRAWIGVRRIGGKQVGEIDGL